jgi:hypothetical protein
VCSVLYDQHVHKSGLEWIQQFGSVLPEVPVFSHKNRVRLWDAALDLDESHEVDQEAENKPRKQSCQDRSFAVSKPERRMSNVLIIYQKLVGWTNDGVIAMRAGMADFHVDLINSAAGTIAIGGGGKPVGRPRLLARWFIVWTPVALTLWLGAMTPCAYSMLIPWQAE